MRRGAGRVRAAARPLSSARARPKRSVRVARERARHGRRKRKKSGARVAPPPASAAAAAAPLASPSVPPHMRDVINEAREGEAADMTIDALGAAPMPPVDATMPAGGDEEGYLSDSPEGARRPLFRNHLLLGSDPPRYVAPEAVNSGENGFEVLFLGTGAMAPQSFRNATSVSVRVHNQNLIFDCGEGTVRQIRQSGLVRLGSIGAVFVTHLHGDHWYGLPSLLLTLASSAVAQPVHVFGPVGLNSMLRGAMVPMAHHYTRVSKRWDWLHVHELLPARAAAGRGGGAPHRRRAGRRSTLSPLAGSRVNVPWHFSEAAAGADGFHDLYTTASARVRAGPLVHRGGDCYGYVVDEVRRPRFDPALLLENNIIKSVLVRRVLEGFTLELSNGAVVRPRDVMLPPFRSRRAVVLGDTCDSEGIAPIAMDADVLVHEATFMNRDARTAALSAHSTAGMAGSFARRVRARSLVLTHFSDRYGTGDHTVRRLVAEAEATYGREGGPVLAARDFSFLPVDGERRDEVDPAEAASRRRRPATDEVPHATRVYREGPAGEVLEELREEDFLAAKL